MKIFIKIKHPRKFAITSITVSIVKIFSHPLRIRWFSINSKFHILFLRTVHRESHSNIHHQMNQLEPNNQSTFLPPALLVWCSYITLLTSRPAPNALKLNIFYISYRYSIWRFHFEKKEKVKIIKANMEKHTFSLQFRLVFSLCIHIHKEEERKKSN